jgi:hypothetical protein
VRRTLFILLATPLAASLADSIKLKSGEVIEGKVISSDRTSVVIETQFSPTITDQRTVARTDIALLSITSSDEAAFTRIRDLKAPATALDAQPYTNLLDNQLRPFLKKFPASTRATDVKAMIQSFEADVARLRRGEKKINGEWYSADAYAAEKYQLEAAVIFEAMQRDLTEKNYVAAMNDFDQLQRSYPASAAYAGAVPLAAKALKLLDQQLTFAIANLPQTLARRQATIDRTPVEQRPPIQAAIDAENARADALAAAAQRNNQRFFAILPYDEKGLKAMQQAAAQVASQLATADEKKLQRAARLITQANAELAHNQLAAAGTSLADLAATWPEYEGLSRLQQRLTSSQSANEASSKAEADGLKADKTIPSSTPAPTPVPAP